jgi:hypothetical protein
MAWETRRQGGPKYYTRTRKVNRRYVREYVGTGARAEAAAAADALRRAERQAQAHERRAEQECLQRADAPLLHLDEALGLLVHVTLTAHGYHRHSKGQWRKRRSGCNSEH